MAQSDDTKVMIILLFTSTMSSGVRNTQAPTLRANEMAYLAFSSCSAGESPEVTCEGGERRREERKGERW